MKEALILFLFLIPASPVVIAQSASKLMLKKADTAKSFDNAVVLYRVAINRAKKEEDNKMVDSILFSLGKRYINAGKLDSAKAIADRTIKRYNRDKKNMLISSFYNMKAISFHHKGELDSAIVYYLKAVALLEAKNDSLKAATIRFNIGNIFLSYKDWEQANGHFEIMLKAIDKYNDSTYLAGVLSALSATQFELGNHKVATKYAQRAIKISIQRHDISGEMLAYRQMGQLTNNEDKIDSAIYYYSKAFVLAEKIGMPYYLAMIKMNLCDAYTKAGKSAAAISAGLASIEFSKTPGFETQLPTVYRFLSEAYQQINDFKNAYHYLNLSNDLKEKKVNEENKKIVNELLVKYKSAKKDKQIAKQELALLAKQKQTNIYLSIVIISILIIVLLVGTITFRHKLNHARIKQLQHQKEQEVLLAIAEGEEHERQKLSTAMHDGLSNMLFGCKLSLSSIAGQVPKISKQLESNIKLLEDAWIESRRISHNLMPIDLENNNLAQAFESYINRMKPTNNNPSIKFQLFGEPTNGLANNQKTLLFRAFQELIGNSIKHSKANEINVQLLYNESEINIVIDDDGQGFNLTKIKGRGLNYLKSKLELINTLIQIETTEGEGTTARISFKYH